MIVSFWCFTFARRSSLRALQSLSYFNMADYDYFHFASLWSLSNQNWKYYKNLLLRLQQSSVHSSVFHFHFIVFVATPLVLMAIGMKLWFKKLAMNQTSRSNQRNEMINRRVSVMLCDCFDIWNTLVSFLARQCLLLYCQVHISLSRLPSKLCAKFLRLCNSALNLLQWKFLSGCQTTSAEKLQLGSLQKGPRFHQLYGE